MEKDRRETEGLKKKKIYCQRVENIPVCVQHCMQKGLISHQNVKLAFSVFYSIVIQ